MIPDSNSIASSSRVDWTTPSNLNDTDDWKLMGAERAITGDTLDINLNSGQSFKLFVFVGVNKTGTYPEKYWDLGTINLQNCDASAGSTTVSPTLTEFWNTIQVATGIDILYTFTETKVAFRVNATWNNWIALGFGEYDANMTGFKCVKNNAGNDATCT